MHCHQADGGGGLVGFGVGVCIVGLGVGTGTYIVGLGVTRGCCAVRHLPATTVNPLQQLVPFGGNCPNVPHVGVGDGTNL